MSDTVAPPQEWLDKLPIGARLFLRTQEAFGQTRKVAFEMLRKTHETEVQDLTPERLEQVRDRTRAAFKPAPSTLLGADTTEIYGLYPPGPWFNENQYFTFSVRLFADGSPFVPENMLGEIEESNFLNIFVGPEQKPFVVTSDRLAKAPTLPNGARAHVDSYMAQLEALGQEPHWLSDADAEELMRLLPTLEINPTETENININLFQPPMPPAAT